MGTGGDDPGGILIREKGGNKQGKGGDRNGNRAQGMREEKSRGMERGNGMGMGTGNGTWEQG